MRVLLVMYGDTMRFLPSEAPGFLSFVFFGSVFVSVEAETRVEHGVGGCLLHPPVPCWFSAGNEGTTP